jgi:hypothetical protein
MLQSSTQSTAERNVSVNSSSGIGFTELLTILFVALKLTNFIDWSWVQVLSPLWISAIVWVVLGILDVFVKLR